MIKNIKTFFLVFLLLIVLSCGEDEKSYDPPKPPTAPVTGKEVGKADVWVTTGSQSKLFLKDSPISIVEGTETTNPSITIDFNDKLQEIEGFGAALTGSSAYLINKKMTESQKADLLKDLFSAEDGIGISYLRTTIGASDFSLSNYTYNDLSPGETDPDMLKFSIEKDKQDVIPVFQSILSVAPSMKIMGSPWSPPAWMKTTGKLGGGSLKGEHYPAFANYFVKYITAFKNEGITLDAITIQNEPLFETTYPSMKMEATEQLAFIKNNLGPTFEKEGITAKIIAYDHNFDRYDYPITILDDPDAKKYVAGSAFHAYGGNVSAMSIVRGKHPDKGLYFTEISGGEWSKDFANNLKYNFSTIFIGTLNNWSKNVLLWNLALDENFGPKNGGCQDCRGVVTISSGGNVTKNIEYYALAHFAKFIRPGAFRVKSSFFESSTKLESVAFINTDGTKVLVVLNNEDKAKTYNVIIGENSFSHGIEANSAETIVWK